MTHAVLTDDDILQIGKGGFSCVMNTCHGIPFARAVEQAVLEKLRQPGGSLWMAENGYSAVTVSCVPESRAVERERAAWGRGAEWAVMTYLNSGPLGFYAESNTERDRRYPLPQPEPKVVTGPSGTKYRKLADGTVQIHGVGDQWTDLKLDWIVKVADAPTVAQLMEGKQ